MTLDEYIAERSAREPEFAEALAILRELVDGKWAGVHVVWPAETHECCYCSASDDGIGVESWKYTDIDHAPDCPIRKGREYLAQTQPT